MIIIQGMQNTISAVKRTYKSLASTPIRYFSNTELLTRSRKIKSPFEFKKIATNSIELNTLCAGDPSKPLLVLLHGFPEYWRAWEKQIDDFVNAGYYVMVPDQRGCGLSSKPSGPENYRPSIVAEDLKGLIKSTGKEKASVGAHGVGSYAAYKLAESPDNLLENLICVNFPSPHVFLDRVKQYKTQKQKISAVEMLTMPILPTWGLMKFSSKFLEKVYKEAITNQKLDKEDLEELEAPLKDKESVKGMLDWLKAAKLPENYQKLDVKIKVPFLLLWGKKDQYFDWEMAEQSLKCFEDSELVAFDEAGHFLLHEEPQQVSQEMINFLNK